MTTSVDQACEAAEQAKQAFFELDEMSVGYGNFDLRELQNGTRRLQELLSCYRSGALQAGADTGEFIEASILMQANQLEQVQGIFPNWLAEQQVRFEAYLVWVTAENAHTAALARAEGDPVEQGLADQLHPQPDALASNRSPGV